MNKPNFQDYRRTDDAVMVADVGFKKQLWALDPELDIVWDWASERWEVWKFPGQEKVKKKVINPKAFHVMKLTTKEKSFRELGADILLQLRAGDPHRFSVKQLIAYFDQMDENIKRSKEKAFANQIESVGKEVSWFFSGHRVQVPKAYEKIAIKLKGPEVGNKIEGVIRHG